MERKDRIDLLGGVVLVVLSAGFGLNQALVKLVNVGFAPIFQAGLRSAVAFIPVLLFALLIRRRLSVSDGSLGPGLVCGLLFSAEFILVFQSLDFTTVSRVSILFYTMPVWLTFAAHFLIPNERMTSVKAIGLALAVGGVALAFLGKEESAGELALIGDLMSLVAAMFWAAIALVARTTTLSRSTPEMQLLYQLAVSAPLLLAIAVLTGETLREPTAFHLGVLGFQGIVIAAGGLLTWFWVLSIYPASNMASFGFLSPVFGVFFGWLIFDDPITFRLLGALLLVGAGIVLVNHRQKPAASG
ncbi:DMT family transporter [Pikeienuella sp. HZG-20]|uniref:DMT family transporter n=1 Tax=Paludibacillus litoralis TaxID=3133267 RepID=UPI0030EC91C7